MHKYEQKVLEALAGLGTATPDVIIKFTGLGRDETLWALENLSQRGLAEIRREKVSSAELTSEGAEYANGKLPEEELMEKVSKKEMRISELKGRKEQIGIQWAKKKSLIRIKEGGVLELTEDGRKALSGELEEESVLRKLQGDPSLYDKLAERYGAAIENLVRRGLLAVSSRNEIKEIRITREGKNLIENWEAAKEDEIDSLTKGVISSGSWKGKRFKSYDISLEVERERAAIKHPLRRLISQLKDNYLSMGFSEISGPIIEPSFWVFDSLFVPQDHPARDAQDTFYLSNPATVDINGTPDISRVRKVHRSAWKAGWSASKAGEAVLRTHVTSVSSRFVYDILSKTNIEKYEGQMPIKLFSVGRVFRNENVDYKHLTDFYQTDGVIIGKNLTLANLFGVLGSIYANFGMKVKFKPAYFPFVEPGVEVYAYSNKVNDWIEMGGAGIIRKEVTGLSRKSTTVLAWGLGVERLVLLKDESIKSITELYNSGVGWMRERRVV